MDKRTLTFLIAMTAIFFLMNQWFNYGKRADARSLIEQPKTQVIFSGQAKSIDPLSQDELKKLTIEKLYRDIDLKEVIGYGIMRRDAFVSIATDLDLPQFAYIHFEDKGSMIRRRLELMVEPENVGDPFLYTAYALVKLETPWVPEEGSLDVSLVYFTDQNVYRISGETLGDTKLILDQKPPQNGILLLEYNGSINPYAIYNSSTNQLNYFDHYPQFENFSLLVYPEDKKTFVEQRDQEYYVLENPFMQLVFSNMNGAIAEINLPFESSDNPYSVVREIGIDRIMDKDYPYNNTFPQFDYFISTPSGKKKHEPVQGGYYPLLRRGVIGVAGITTTDINPNYYALNVIEQDKMHEAVLYTLKRFEKNLIEFEYSTGNRRITKIFTLPNNPQEAPYTFDLTVKLDGDARNLSLSLGIPEVELISGSFNPTLKYQVTRNQKIKIEEIKPPKNLVTFSAVTPNWACNGNGFFGVILEPLKLTTPGLSVFPVSGELVPSRITVIDAQYHRYPTNKYPGYAILLPMMAKTGVSNYRVFAGPFDKAILEQASKAFANPTTGARPDLTGAKSYHGWFAFISQPFAKFLFIIMNFFHQITHSWGISIILLTVVLRLMLYPLNNWSMKSMAKMQKVTPKVQAIQEKYKKDPKRAQLEIMNLYRKEGANPFGGCVPMIIQLPFLFGMFDLLKSSFELRGVSFIPGWINNLTAPDVLFSWEYPIPFVGTSFHLLPVLLGVIMYFQQKLTSTGSAAKAVTDQQKQQRMVGNMMTIVFTVLFYHFPSGLNIYWISSMSLGILQQWWINKKQMAKGT